MNTQQQKIRKLLASRNGILLAHYYVRPEIQNIADVLGDSLALAQVAASSEAKVIVFAGVHFMAQSAAILCPDKTILLPRPDAGCPLADMADAASIQAMREKEPDAVFVTYINSTAEVKALSDICCTSSNAAKVLASLPSGKKVVMLPDGNLARHMESITGREVLPWKGCCPIHDTLTAARLRKLKAGHPNAPFAAHPECRPDVLALADFIGSTSAIIGFAKKSGASRILIGTEEGVLTELKKQNPDKEFILASPELFCADMKKISLADIEKALETLQPAVTVSDDVSRDAKRALDKMLAIS